MAVKGCRVRGCGSCLFPELIQVGEGQGDEWGGGRVGGDEWGGGRVGGVEGVG